MERVKAAISAGVVAVAIFAGLMVIRLLMRLVAITVWLMESAAILLFACLIGYIAYRVLAGESDDPRYT